MLSGANGGFRLLLQVTILSCRINESTIQSWMFFIDTGLREVSGPLYWGVAGAFLFMVLS